MIAMFRTPMSGRQPVLHVLALFSFMLAFLDAAYLSPFNSRGVPGDARNWVPMAALVFGLLSMFAFGWQFYSIYRSGGDKTKSGWSSCLSLVFVVLGGYMAGTAVDHMTFFSDPNSSGKAAADALGVKDVQCEQMVLVRLTSTGADYRCPVSISLGVMSSTPFVPWPSYLPGHSPELKAAIEMAFRETHRLDGK
ncbi:hypothetical protein [Janthinobacterium sp. NKUCC08_JDC]|uniref:hypothetical protein n=1 Tax=Janthinobacterium sp. NKUCC08_JDC TaxID=2842122 RepID=UPI001C5AD564|nr:hypothetical protein [Janthinobacterium sp. NKUCC08_JDC]MBW3499896.1 hypothetical protein [Janthinobacterium sp. NKUCC08_JDC]